MTLGSPSIKREADLWNKSRADGYLLMTAIGMLAGIVVAYARMPLHLPGHKAIWWIVPVLTARLLTRRIAAASVGATVTVLTALSLGGRLAGGAVGVPLVIVAGTILDWAALHAQGAATTKLRLLAWLSIGAALANLVCFVKRLFEPAGAFFSATNLHDLMQAAASYAVFGLVSGALAGALVLVALRFRQSERSSDRVIDIKAIASKQ